MLFHLSEPLKEFHETDFSKYFNKSREWLLHQKQKSDDLLYNTEDVRLPAWSQEITDDTIASEQTWVNTEWPIERTHTHTHTHTDT